MPGCGPWCSPASLLQDVIDLRHASWVERRQVEGPKTISEIHRDAQREAMNKASMGSDRGFGGRDRGFGGRDRDRGPPPSMCAALLLSGAPSLHHVLLQVLLSLPVRRQGSAGTCAGWAGALPVEQGSACRAAIGRRSPHSRRAGAALTAARGCRAPPPRRPMMDERPEQPRVMTRVPSSDYLGPQGGAPVSLRPGGGPAVQRVHGDPGSRCARLRRQTLSGRGEREGPVTLLVIQAHLPSLVSLSGVSRSTRCVSVQLQPLPDSLARTSRSCGLGHAACIKCPWQRPACTKYPTGA